MKTFLAVLSAIAIVVLTWFGAYHTLTYLFSNHTRMDTEQTFFELGKTTEIDTTSTVTHDIVEVTRDSVETSNDNTVDLSNPKKTFLECVNSSSWSTRVLSQEEINMLFRYATEPSYFLMSSLADWACFPSKWKELTGNDTRKHISVINADSTVVLNFGLYDHLFKGRGPAITAYTVNKTTMIASVSSQNTNAYNWVFSNEKSHLLVAAHPSWSQTSKNRFIAWQ